MTTGSSRPRPKPTGDGFGRQRFACGLVRREQGTSAGAQGWHASISRSHSSSHRW